MYGERSTGIRGIIMQDFAEDKTKFTKIEICNALSKHFCKDCSSPCSICKIKEAIVVISRMEQEDQADE